MLAHGQPLRAGLDCPQGLAGPEGRQEHGRERRPQQAPPSHRTAAPDSTARPPDAAPR